MFFSCGWVVGGGFAEIGNLNNPIDLLIVAAFVAVILAIGFSTRLRESSFFQFLAAGRTLSLPLFVASLVSTWYGGILGVGESVASYGIGTWLLLGVPYYVFGLIYAMIYVRRVRKEDQLSIPERLAARFGIYSGTISGFIVLGLALPAAHIFMLGILIQTLTHWSTFTCVTIAGLGGALFLFRGGFLADARMGVIAFLAMYVGFIAIDWFCLSNHGIISIFHQLPLPEQRRLDGGQGPLAILTFFILGAWTLVDPAFHQRVVNSAEIPVAQRGVLISVICWMVFDVLSITAGIEAVVLLKHPPTNPVAIFPVFGLTILPPGLRALFFMGMVATVLSALVGYSLVSGTTLAREVIARLAETRKASQGKTNDRAGKADDRREVMIVRISLVLSNVAAILLALMVRSVVDLWYDWAGALVGALLIPVSLSYLSNRPLQRYRRTAELSMVLASVVGIGWMFYGLRTDNQFLTVSLFRQSFSLGTMIPALATSGLVWAVGAIVLSRRILETER